MISVKPNIFHREQFGASFEWGVVISSFQNEGGTKKDGKGPSIWDDFVTRKGKIKDNTQPIDSGMFYDRFREDIILAKSLGFDVFRFSIAWPRIFPNNMQQVNQAGINFYHRVIDACIAVGLEPVVTLYHWDLPCHLEEKGGWAHRGIIFAFEKYVQTCAMAYGNKVKRWIVLNEPLAFTSLGYMLGIHAPGKRGLSYFLPAVHHACMAQAMGGRILRELSPGSKIGNALSCSYIYPAGLSLEDEQARKRADALVNRLFLEPALGLGYPVEEVPVLSKIERRYSTWRDWDILPFQFDFIGLQNYFPLVVKHHSLIPILQLAEVKPRSRKVPTTALGWEISGDGLFHILQQFSQYKSIPSFIITEGGAAFNEQHTEQGIHDPHRVAYFEEYLMAALKAKKSGVPLDGYYVWTLTDNFEWAEGYRAKFGLVHVDPHSGERKVKDSGIWFRSWLRP